MKREKLFGILFYSVVSVVILQAAVFLSSFGTDSHIPAKKILFIGDSMTGWLAERLNAYGEENGFEVATVVWDSSTIKKWGTNPKFAQLVEQQSPDAIFISLGMNDLFEPNPSKLKGNIDSIKKVAGGRPILWVGPPSWPGYDKGKALDEWLKKELGEDSYFSSLGLTLPRQSAKNPHPTRDGMVKWMDAVVEWMPENAAVKLPGVVKPTGSRMVRGKTFIYKRAKENL